MAPTSEGRGAIDFRSDALCAPTEEMWEAMRRAEVGWALKGEDRAVNELERIGAELVGKEAAIFVSTCSMANLLALMTLGTPGTRMVAGRTMHVATTEAWSLAHPLGLIPHLVEDGCGVPELNVDAIGRLSDGSGSRVSVVCLENSHNNSGGVAITVEQAAAIANAARRVGAAVHLDGARLFNAAVALNVTPRALAEAADTVSISLNKGLGAPWGALLCGPRAVIETARINAHRIGAASVHKAGIFAAAGIIALTTMRDRLADDDRRATDLARRLAAIPGLCVRERGVQTNLVVVETAAAGISAPEIVARLAGQGVLALARSRTSIRFVTYRQIDDRDVGFAAQALGRVMGETR